MKLYMTRGVFFRDETNENDQGQDWAQGTVQDVPDVPADPKKEPAYATKFALGLLSQGRAKLATDEDIAAAARQDRLAKLREQVAAEQAKAGAAVLDDEEAALTAKLAELTGGAGKKGK